MYIHQTDVQPQVRFVSKCLCQQGQPATKRRNSEWLFCFVLPCISHVAI